MKDIRADLENALQRLTDLVSALHVQTPRKSLYPWILQGTINELHESIQRLERIYAMTQNALDARHPGRKTSKTPMA
jgi:archaellum component FlaC